MIIFNYFSAIMSECCLVLCVSKQRVLFDLRTDRCKVNKKKIEKNINVLTNDLNQ